MYLSLIHIFVYMNQTKHLLGAAETCLREYASQTGAKVYLFRLTNVFGKWCRPNYNSVVATFCHHIANDLPITCLLYTSSNSWAEASAFSFS